MTESELGKASFFKLIIYTQFELGVHHLKVQIKTSPLCNRKDAGCLCTKK